MKKSNSSVSVTHKQTADKQIDITMSKNIEPHEGLLYEEDHLLMIFQHFFKFIKYGGEVQHGYIRDALNGALSGLKYGFDRGYYLEKLSAAIQVMIEVTNHELQNRPLLNKTYWGGEEYKQEFQKLPKEVMTLEEVVKEFGLVSNNIKNKAWRDDNGFPYTQPTPGGKVTYYRSKVNTWVEKR